MRIAAVVIVAFFLASPPALPGRDFSMLGSEASPQTDENRGSGSASLHRLFSQPRYAGARNLQGTETENLLQSNEFSALEISRPHHLSLRRGPTPGARSLPAQSASRPQGRLFPPQDLGLLEGPDRDDWQKPDLIMDALGIFDGAKVAELGAGGGWFTVHLARRVGPNGIVYAQDIQPLMLEAIGRRVQRENLQNVKTVLGTATDPRLPAGLDAVLIVNAYYEINDPGHPEVIVALLKNVARSLKPQGRIGVVDFTPGAGGPGPAPDERVDPQDVIKSASASGLKLLSHETVPPFVYLLVFGKDTTPGRPNDIRRRADAFGAPRRRRGVNHHEVAKITKLTRTLTGFRVPSWPS